MRRGSRDVTSTRLATAVSSLCRGRSSVNAAFDEQSPDDASHLLLAKATVTSIFGLRSSIWASQDPARIARRQACRITALAPRISKRRMVRSPRFEMVPSFCFPPVDFCSGVSPGGENRVRLGNSLPPAQVP